MIWTERTDTTNTWNQFQQQERGDVAFDANIAFDFQVPFDGWDDPDIYWSNQNNINSSWSEQPQSSTDWSEQTLNTTNWEEQ